MSRVATIEDTPGEIGGCHRVDGDSGYEVVHRLTDKITFRVRYVVPSPERQAAMDAWFDRVVARIMVEYDAAID